MPLFLIRKNLQENNFLLSNPFKKHSFFRPILSRKIISSLAFMKQFIIFLSVPILKKIMSLGGFFFNFTNLEDSYDFFLKFWVVWISKIFVIFFVWNPHLKNFKLITSCSVKIFYPRPHSNNVDTFSCYIIIIIIIILK